MDGCRGKMIVRVPVLVVLMGALKVLETVLVVHVEGGYYMPEWRCRWSYWDNEGLSGGV